ncbi:protoporphyrinogen/coproporphyrinogen oxidase [Longimicrobium sp.]|uniref:protoporphyrinogen/coproporphyrinogen oxidase n=1 Tax=Longimicrobium sp. TaxID=2029185 RepID=UPI002BD5538C|nr:FAD-dependent oxidoreductase [Longimicrobium sp.]HSU13783.1 FAD-dependent oxidoreductase [Longimicrobium sp.]
MSGASAAAGMRVAVVGGGPAGLAAAFRLARGGARVTVLEAAPAWGGRTRTDEVDGCRVDTATQLFGSVYTRFLRLLREAGAGALCERTSGRDALWRRGAAHEVVYGSPTSMLASGAIPFGLKFRLGTHYLPYLHRHGDALRMDALEQAAAAGLDRESIAAWGAREMGHDFVDLLADPMLCTLYGTRADEASAAFYHALARQGTSLDVLALRGGARGFCDALAASVRQSGGEVRVGAAVRAVSADGSGVEISGDGDPERFDAAVVALPAPAARGLAHASMPRMGDWLGAVPVRPTATIAVVLDRPVGARWFGLSFARGESKVLAAVCSQEAKLPGLVAPGMGVLVALPLPEAGAALWGATAEQALAAILPDLAKPFPAIERMIRTVRVYRWEHGWTVFGAGYLHHLARLRAERPDADQPRVAFAGDYLVAPNVEGAVISGLRAADRLLAAEM